MTAGTAWLAARARAPAAKAEGTSAPAGPPIARPPRGAREKARPREGRFDESWLLLHHLRPSRTGAAARVDNRVQHRLSPERLGVHAVGRITCRAHRNAQ